MIVISFSLFSQTCCSGGVPITNNIGLPILSKGDFQFGLFYDYNNLNTLKEGATELKDNSRQRKTNSILFNFNYNITNRLSIEGLLTWVNQQRIITFSENVNLDQTFGVGDAVIFSRYLLLNKELDNFIVGAGVKLPVGSSNEKNELGIFYAADIQPGSDAYDYLMSATYARRFKNKKSRSVSLRMMYKVTGVNNEYQNVNEYKFGNEFQVFFNISDQFLIFKQLITPTITLRYRDAKKDRVNSDFIDSTGGKWLFLTPTINIALSSNIDFITQVEIPLYSEVEGVQLTPTYRINTGILIRMKKKLKSSISYE